MPKPEFILFEVLAILIFLVCLGHAIRRGKSRVLELLASLVYGVFLEWMTIQQVQAYSYGRFFIMFDGAPFCIGLGWAIIIYSAMEFTDKMNMPVAARPFLAGFLALNIDAGMDAVAIRLGFWNWVIPLDMQWFGVPYGNFWAWFVVVTSFSGFIYIFRSYGWQLAERGWKRLAYPLLSLAGSIIVLAFSNWFFVSLFGKSDFGSTMAMVGLLLCGAIVVYLSKPAFIPSDKINWVSLSVPLVFHTFFVIFGFSKGYFMEHPLLGVVGVSMGAVGIGIHLYPWYLTRKSVIRMKPPTN
jgi:hypothetical protein